MDSFKNFLAAIDTPGGHIIIACLLGMAGVWVQIHGHEMVANQLLQFLGIAAYAMRGMNGRGQNPQQTPTPTQQDNNSGGK